QVEEVAHPLDHLARLVEAHRPRALEHGARQAEAHLELPLLVADEERLARAVDRLDERVDAGRVLDAVVAGEPILDLAGQRSPHQFVPPGPRVGRIPRAPSSSASREEPVFSQRSYSFTTERSSRAPQARVPSATSASTAAKRSNLAASSARTSGVRGSPCSAAFARVRSMEAACV